ncbi:NAD-dependent epimerase [Fulvivirga kasyanovii]|uniref:NAD-dependent epimerase n=1 Tax=Fulvivirga kasyanovii TaxID=396812 RepID=A0ABW9RTD6_9BACT|nr:NAD-dependent epimerase [Fulvivirga kasyanovii]MTI26330.1 NAD-dependent epimerase [Fulvivirga kasyanovii]
MDSILVTGAAGFIGFHLCKVLCNKGYNVTGIDNLNDYYDVNLKKSRLSILETKDNFDFQKLDLEDQEGIEKLFKTGNFSYVVNLAAQAGVRYSLTNPRAYIKSNIDGFLNILEGCRYSDVKHLIYASSSSVYGANTKMPFSVEHNVDHPVSLYAATKKSNELMAHTYSHLYGLPTTGLRFFTVYGPYGRPDMALFLFTKAIIEGKPIDVYNHGKIRRDFTYVDDIVEGIVRLIPTIPSGNPDWDGNQPNPSDSFAPYKIHNIGNNQPVELMDFINAIEDALGKTAIKNMMPIQPGDVPATYADVDALTKSVGFKPNTSIKTGIQQFVNWYLDYYKIKNYK